MERKCYAILTACLLLIALLSLVSASAVAEPLKISVLTDMSGPYAGITGANVEAAKMAIADFGGKVLGEPIEFVYRDHMCKPDVANQKAKELYEKGAGRRNI